MGRTRPGAPIFWGDSPWFDCLIHIAKLFALMVTNPGTVEGTFALGRPHLSWGTHQALYTLYRAWYNTSDVSLVNPGWRGIILVCIYNIVK